MESGERERLLRDEVPTPEGLAQLREKIGELAGSVHRLEESYQRLQALDIESIIKGGNENG